MITNRKHEEIVARKIKAARRTAWMEEKIRQQGEMLRSMKAKLWGLRCEVDDLSHAIEELKKKGSLQGFYQNEKGEIYRISGTGISNAYWKDASAGSAPDKASEA